MDRLKIFISSTMTDLQAERQAVERAIAELRLEAVRAETLGSQPVPSRQACLEMARQCDIYLGIYGPRYGWVPTGDQVSVTEMEFQEARTRGKDILVYVKDVPKREKAQEDLLRRVEDFDEGYFQRPYFTTPEQLAEWVKEDIAALVSRRYRGGEETPFHVPFPRNLNFVGRDTDLAELHRLLQDEGVVGITGLGGIGKTQLAAEYAHAHDDDYPDGIFWLNATDDYLSELARLGRALRLPETDRSAANADLQMAQAFGNYLNNHPKALLVIDNIEDPADLNQERVKGVVPTALRCRVLFTTRRHAPPGFVTHSLKFLSPDAARTLLLYDKREERDIETANTICDTLGRLPLAIKLAGAYLKENKKITLAGYLERLTAEGSLTTVDATGLTEADLETRHIPAVEATLREQWKLVKDPDAQRLFRVAGLLRETQAIPLARLSLLTGLSQGAKPGYASPLDKALAALVKMSLVEELANEQIQLHPLVREFAERLTPDADRQSFTGRACRNLIEAYKDPAVLEHHILHRPRGIDDVMADVREALAFSPQKTASTSFLQEFYRLLNLEAHNLRSAQAKETPGFVLQQLQNRAASERMGYDASAITDELRSRPDPYLIHRHPIAGEPPTLIRTLRGHNDAVYACAVTPEDGKKVVSASQDGTLRVWELATGREIVTMAVGWSVHGCAVTPDGKRVVSLEEWRPPRVWDLVTGEEVLTLEGETRGKVYSCAITPDGSKLVVRYDGDTKLWDLINGRELHTFDKDIWDLIEKRWNYFYHPGSDQYGHAITPDGAKVIYGTRDGILGVYDSETGRELMILKGHTDAVKGCTVTPDSKYLISASWDETLKVWDLTTGHEIATLIGHSFRVNDCKITPDGKYLISASHDMTLKVWDLERIDEPQPKRSHQDGVYRCMVTPDGKKAISASADGTSKIWDIETGVELATLQGYGCAMTPDGQKVVSACRDGALRIWDIEAGVELATLEGRGKFVAHDCVVTPDEDSIISWSGGLLKVWDIASQRERFTLKSGVRRCNVTPDSTKAILKLDESIVVLNLADGEVLLTLTDKGIINDCTITPDGKRIISASNDNSLKIWDLETGELITTLTTTFRSPIDKLKMCTISPDGKHLVSVATYGTLKIWDCATWHELATLEGHKWHVFACTFTPDGKYVVSGSLDYMLSVWSVADGREVSRLEGVASFTSIAVAPNSRDIIAGDFLGNVHFLEFNPSRLVEK